MSVKAKQVTDRRALRFGRIDDILADVEQLGRAPSIRTTGNWTAAGCVDHVTKTMLFSLDGFPPEVKAPLPIRIFGRFMKSSVLNRPLRAGFKFPSRVFEPDAAITWDQAAEKLRAVATRIAAGERFSHPSPVFGPMVHEEWEQLHCRHAELHFSFMHAESGDPGSQAAGETDSLGAG